MIALFFDSLPRYSILHTSYFMLPYNYGHEFLSDITCKTRRMLLITNSIQTTGTWPTCPLCSEMIDGLGKWAVQFQTHRSSTSVPGSPYGTS